MIVNTSCTKIRRLKDAFGINKKSKIFLEWRYVKVKKIHDGCAWEVLNRAQYCQRFLFHVTLLSPPFGWSVTLRFPHKMLQGRRRERERGKKNESSMTASPGLWGEQQSLVISFFFIWNCSAIWKTSLSGHSVPSSDGKSLNDMRKTCVDHMPFSVTVFHSHDTGWGVPGTRCCVICWI